MTYIHTTMGDQRRIPEAHCADHKGFEYDCLDCSDELERVRKSHYRASPALEAFIIAQAPAHTAVPLWRNPPASLKALEPYRFTRPMIVSNEHSANTIYSRPEVNFAFRAWHDSLHLALNAEFDAEGELLVARAHEQAVREAIKAGHLTELDCCALFFEVWGQFRYAEEHAGQFPADQAAFVASCFADGLSAAILKDF